MKAFKIRCSAIGKIMTNPRTKGELLSQTAKTYIEEEVLRAKYGIIKTFSSRYTDKGNLVEDEAIDMASNALEIGFLYKNHEHFENEFLTGTPDVNTNDILLDVKSSFGMLLPFRFLLRKYLPKIIIFSCKATLN
jgi:hypothetical protein